MKTVAIALLVILAIAQQAMLYHQRAQLDRAQATLRTTILACNQQYQSLRNARRR